MLSYINSTCRLEIQGKVRQMGRNPGNAEREAVEKARERLTVLRQELMNTMRVAGVVEVSSICAPAHESLECWDEILNESTLTGNGQSTSTVPAIPAQAGIPLRSTSPLQIEDEFIPLPSNGNVSQEYVKLELQYRLSYADYHLNRIRDLIAEKSFQYSHVIRNSPRKAVNTQSRAAVKRLNLDITVQCRLYSQCRSRLASLGADPATINAFRKLTAEDIKASTAIVNPNEPGSTQLKLSWIWQTSGGHRWGLATGSDTLEHSNDLNVLECKFNNIFLYLLH